MEKSFVYMILRVHGKRTTNENFDSIDVQRKIRSIEILRCTVHIDK